MRVLRKLLEESECENVEVKTYKKRLQIAGENFTVSTILMGGLNIGLIDGKIKDIADSVNESRYLPVNIKMLSNIADYTSGMRESTNAIYLNYDENGGLICARDCIRIRVSGNNTHNNMKGRYSKCTNKKENW
jgi:hypothetical protein